MLIIFESVLPIFLVIAFGAVLKRVPLFSEAFWSGLNQLGYYVLFPALLVTTLARADFSSLEAGRIGWVALLAVAAITALSIALWPILRRTGLGRPAFTSVFQTTTRWNAFVALAIADKFAGLEGMAVISLMMTATIVPLNIINVLVLVSFSEEKTDIRVMVRNVVTNPMIIAALVSIVINVLGIPIYDPLYAALDLLARAALGMGLLLVGAGLVIADALKPKPMVLLPTALKLILFPLVTYALATAFGITGMTLTVMVLGASVPTAMNGYVLARQLGGDARLYSAVVTVQTVASIITLPIALLLVGGG
ncbi:AEC family transporter [Martelella mediterranea]|uniref:AEC family transporter n=1 Tax=Martelella mediterranea TaxID=293089 RepID=UPI001E44C1E8|nr:AEC family transporter [Martelella mediterranea]MCD1634823.1 AEC family transporter [Martelella mediterranea]